MVRALTEYDVRGISTTIGFCRDLIGSPAFAAAEFDTTYVDRLLEQNGRRARRSEAMEEIAAIAAAMCGDRPTPTAMIVDRDRQRSTASSVQPTIDDRRPTSLWAQRARLESLR